VEAGSSTKKIRVVVAKPGLDGHDRGAKVIARALRDAGMEVIYTGLHQTPEQIAETVLQEDADAVGLSILSGAHMTLVPRVVNLLREQGAEDVVVTVGGTIPAETVRRLACDAAITRITGIGELEHEITRSSRTVPPSTRRALVARDGHCVFPGCDRPAPWCDGHHLKFWADDGPTKLENLGLVCGEHHRKVHEEGWTLERKDGRWVAKPPPLKIAPHARSA